VFQVFILHHTGGKNPHAMAKFFKASDLQSAITRGKRYCENLRLRFIRVDPFLTDLDEEEKREIE
jgi:hypothetical protein